MLPSTIPPTSTLNPSRPRPSPPPTVQDTTVPRHPFLSKLQQCFAVTQGADDCLDVARTTFNSLTESIHRLAEAYCHQWPAAGFKVSWAAITC